MARKPDIFSRQRLTAGQLRSVAEKRFGDAQCLVASGVKARFAGAMYVAGFVIECLLKALLLERHRNLAGIVDPASLSKTDREAYGLLFSHNLADLLDLLPEVEAKLTKVNDSGSRSLWDDLAEVCAQWTIYARYSPRDASKEEAQRFIAAIDEVRRWLKQL
jgi:hypothetical protein